MFRGNAHFIKTFAMFRDMCLVGAALLIVLLSSEAVTALSTIQIIVLTLWVLATWHLSLRAAGMYAEARLAITAIVLRLSVAVFIYAALQAAFFLAVGWQGVEGFLTPRFPLAALVLLVSGSLASRFVTTRYAKFGFDTSRVLIVGTGGAALRYADEIRLGGRWQESLVGFLLDEADFSGCEWSLGKSGADSDGNSGTHKVLLGTRRELEAVIVRHSVDRVVFSFPLQTKNSLRNDLLLCERLGVDAVILPSVDELKIAKARVDDRHGAPVLTFSTAPQAPMSLLAKRCVDACVSALLLMLLAPFFLIVGILVRLGSPGPVFFRQLRVGLHGRTFSCWKFRTMYKDAELRLAELQLLNEMDGPVFKMAKDPRITPVGRVLRKFSFDELPQLINVLKGDMSLVGPRPPLPAEVAQYESWQRRRLSVKPGLTCTWQVAGRNGIRFDEWMRLDLEYIDRWSLQLDFKLLLKTIPAVLRGTGV